jgi:hypothetical protein
VRRRKRKRYIDQWEWRESQTGRRQDELHLGERVAATLRWQGLLSNLAYGRSPEGEWTFDRPRILSRDVKVRDTKTDALVAILHVRWTGDATLEFVDGHSVDWSPTNFWQTEWAFFGATGGDAERALIAFADSSRLLEARTVVTFYPSDLSSKESALLTLFGRYLMILHRNDSAAVAASTASVAAG